MPKLPKISGDKAVKALKKIGFKISRQVGSHIVLKKPTIERSKNEYKIIQIPCTNYSID